MTITVGPSSYFVFDLDDTLYPEVDFVRSAFREIAGMLPRAPGEDHYCRMAELFARRENVFWWIVQNYGGRVPGLSVEALLDVYRRHMPSIRMDDAAALFLQRLKGLAVPAGLVTDGRSLTQRNKISALGLSDYFRDVLISEEFGSGKPDERNFLYFEEKYPGASFVFFGDNTAKDFVGPARLGWTTVCIRDKGQNIHRQDLRRRPRPDYVLSSFDEIILCH